MKTVNVADFTGSFTLGDLEPYTTYIVYVTAVTWINAMGRQLEGSSSESIIKRTLAGSK